MAELSSLLSLGREVATEVKSQGEETYADIKKGVKALTEKA